MTSTALQLQLKTEYAIRVPHVDRFIICLFLADIMPQLVHGMYEKKTVHL